MMDSVLLILDFYVESHTLKISSQIDFSTKFQTAKLGAGKFQ
jgi:hypothetical protein